MKTSKYIITGLLTIICSCTAILAQDTILNRNVSVEREYRPVILDAGKVNSLPQILEPKAEKVPTAYSNFNLPLNADYNIHTLPAAGILADKSIDKPGFARIGFGTYLNSLVDASYLLINKPDMLLNAKLNHDGTLEAKRFHTTTKADVAFEKQFKNISLYAGLGGSHEYLKYYGDTYNLDNTEDFKLLASLFPISTYNEVNRTDINSTGKPYSANDLKSQPEGDTFWRMNALVGFSSSQSQDIRYQAEVKYNLFSSINGLTENMIHTQASYSSPSEKNRMGVDLELYNLFYNSATISPFNFWDSYSVLNLNPYYSMQHDQWKVRIGVKTAFSFVHGDGFNPSADVTGEWNPIPKLLSVYGGVTGGYEINSQNKIFAGNPFLYSDLRVKDTYTPFNLYAGTKIKPVDNLMFNAFVDFRQVNNQYFFVNKEYKLENKNSSLSMPLPDSSLFSNRFNLVYSSATLFRGGIRATYNLPDIMNVELKGTYNGWNVATEEHAWNKPTFEAEMNANYKIDKSFSVSLNAFYEGGRFAKHGKKAVAMNDKADINVGLNYRYDKQFSAFAKINNLFNSQYQDFYGYDVQGINFMIGGAVSF
ncbi:MAG: hypothetical protein WCL70_13545 [Paludibacter sp.]